KRAPLANLLPLRSNRYGPGVRTKATTSLTSRRTPYRTRPLFHSLAQLLQVDLADTSNADCQCRVRVSSGGQAQRSQGGIEVIPHLLNVYRLKENPRQIAIGPGGSSEPGAFADRVHGLPHLNEMRRADFRDS